MKKIQLILILILFFTGTYQINAATFYIDPSLGNINNDGSINSPYSTLSEVINNNLIESYAYSPLPYNAATSILAIKNPGAPISSGDTLVLRDGLHGSLDIANYNNLDYITIIAESGHSPIIEKVKLQACKFWRIENIKISSEPYGNYLNNKLIFLETHSWQGPTSHIEIIGCDIYSTQSPWTSASDWVNKASDGIFITGDSINILNNTIRNIDMGITASADYINVVNNKIINFSGDGMRILGSYILFEKNLIKNCYNVDDNHDDGIQSFVINGIVADNNIVRGNIILNYDDPDQPLLGPLQGIGCFDGFYNNWIVENNLIVVNHWHGITFLGANNCKIINNTVLDPTPNTTPGASWISIDDHKNGTPSSGCIAVNNVANTFTVDAQTGNNMTLLNYADYSANFVNYAENDFHLVPSSILINAADGAFSPPFDIDGTQRPQANSPDIGCYEYVDSTVAVLDLLTPNNTVHIFPNPAHDGISVKSENIDPAGEIVISTLNGLVLQTCSYTRKEIKIDISQLPNGIYFIQIKDKRSRLVYSEKLIKI